MVNGETVHHAFFDRAYKESGTVKVKCYADAYTVYIKLLDNPVFETQEISENILIDS